jgi:hypothetical protein
MLNHGIKGSFQEQVRDLSRTLSSLMRMHGDSDMNIWPAAEENLNRVVNYVLANQPLLDETVVLEFFKVFFLAFSFNSLSFVFACLTRHWRRTHRVQRS